MTLDVFSAGAGTGKTHNICEELASRIKNGLDPRRVLACTFTKVAAAELKRRVQSKLIQSGMGKEAEALEGALLGTFHSVGLQLLTRFAVHAGLSPNLRVMVEGGEDRVLKALVGLGEEKAWNDYSSFASRLGFKDKQSNDLPLQLIQQKRRNAISDESFTNQMRHGADELLEILHPGLKPGKNIDDCHAAARAVAERILKTLDSIPAAKDEDCYSDVSDFTQSSPRTWNEIARLAKLKGNKKPGTHAALEPLREVGRDVRKHPGLAADIIGFTDSLISVCITLQGRYSRYKDERGLVDYTDLEERFLRLIQDPEIAKVLSREIQLVIVDEFQDTNPVQLAVFQELSHLTDSSLWVGDPKQAIYGFNGTDPALMNTVMEKTKGLNKKTLAQNNRSNATLVDFFNQLFVPTFGEEARVTAKHPANENSLGIWQLAATNLAGEYQALALGIAELIRSGTRPGDIAVLARRNDYAKKVAAELRNLGIPALVEMSGLLSTRECALAMAALRVVRDRNDAAAAAQVLYLLGHTDWLEKRMSDDQKRSVPFSDQPVLSTLGRVDAKGLSPTLAVAAVFNALELPTLIATWGDAGIRSTHLDSLLALAGRFEEQFSKDGRAVTLGGFLSWLEKMEEDEDDVRRPQRGLNAVNLFTYHSSKGLEWPIVILADLDKIFSPRYWDASLTGGEPETGQPLKDRHLRFWPWPFGRSEFSNDVNDPLDIEDELNLNPIGKPIKTAEEAEALRLLYVGFTRARNRIILAPRFDPKKGEYKQKWLDCLTSFGAMFGNVKNPGNYQLPGQSGFVAVQRHDSPKTINLTTTHTEEQWLPVPNKEMASAAPRTLSPSDAPPMDLKFFVEKLPGISPFTVPPKSADAANLGEACHAYFSSLPSTQGLNTQMKERVASRLLDGFGLPESITSKQLVAAGERLHAWIESHYPGAIWLTEFPMQALEGPSVLAGIADLVLETKSGLIIIDHKAIGTEAKSAVQAYSGQLCAYGRIMKSRDLWFHLPFTGEMVQLKPE